MIGGTKSDLIFFHALSTNDLEKIIAANGLMLAPSVGICKHPKFAKSFGDIILIGGKTTIRGMQIFERDIWSPKPSMVPEKIYELNESEMEAVRREFFPNRFDIWRKIAEALRSELMDHDPIYHAKLMIDSEYKIDEYVSKEIFPRHPGRWMDCNYPSSSVFYDYILNRLYKEVPKTIPNMVKWMKAKWAIDPRGQDSFAYAYAIAAKEIPFGKLEERSDTLISDQGIDFEQIKNVQWKIMQSWSDKLIKGASPHDVQTMFGDALKGHSFASFKRTMQEYGGYAYPGEATLKRAYTELSESIHKVPSEYFEAKTMEAVSIRKFKIVMLPVQMEIGNEIFKDFFRKQGLRVIYYKPEAFLNAKNFWEAVK